MKWVVLVVAVLVLLPILLIGCHILGAGWNWVGKSIDVVSKEVDPAYLLKKYEWFKDASASLDNKIATIQVMDNRIASIDKVTAQRSDKEQMYVWMSEVAGIKASYNQLVSEYNSQMSKLNWRFCNVGNLPQGATEVLPREYNPYETK